MTSPTMIGPTETLLDMDAKPLPVDIISTLPSCIIEKMLCHLPIKDAVSTSILSREWRYIWTKIPELVFYEEDMFDEPSDGIHVSCWGLTSIEPRFKWKLLIKRCKLLIKRLSSFGKNSAVKKKGVSKVFNAIFQVLLMHKGPVIEFALEIEGDGEANDYSDEIEKIIDHLLGTNTVKKLSLDLQGRLPVSVLSLHRLTNLELTACGIYFEPTFSGLSSLTRLSLDNVNISKRALLHLISTSPLLKTLDLYIDANNIVNSDDTSIKELFKCLRRIQNLGILSSFIQVLIDTPLMKSKIAIKLDGYLDIRLEHLNELYIIDFPSLKHEVEFVKLLLVKAPKLKKVGMVLSEVSEAEGLTLCNTLENYSGFWLEHLNEFEIKFFSNLMHEMEFLKIFLAKSPVLKKVNIILDHDVTKDEELLISKNLLCQPSVSSTIEFIVERLPR